MKIKNEVSKSTTHEAWLAMSTPHAHVIVTLSKTFTAVADTSSKRGPAQAAVAAGWAQQQLRTQAAGSRQQHAPQDQSSKPGRSRQNRPVHRFHKKPAGSTGF
jgi:hypothetical protein